MPMISRYSSPFATTPTISQHDRGYYQQQEKGDHPSSFSLGYSAEGQQTFASGKRIEWRLR